MIRKAVEGVGAMNRIRTQEEWLPPRRGKLSKGRLMSELTWLRVGGPAEWLFQPADEKDLSEFLSGLDREIPLFVVGAGTNLIVRDGGIAGVVVRLGRPFSKIEFDGCRARIGAAALGSRVAVEAAENGLDLTFLRTIPGTAGGAVRMNAGCYGTYLADVFEEATIVARSGEIARIDKHNADFAYRSSSIPDGSVVVSAVLKCPRGQRDELLKKMSAQVEKRNATQPTKAGTAGSTFRNPSGFSSTGLPGETHELKAWKLIDDGGFRGARMGRAQVSSLHPNFLLNLGGATATDFETLGEKIREKVLEEQGISLEWEVVRVGEYCS